MTYVFLDVPAHAGQCTDGTTCLLAIEVAYTPRARTFAEYLDQVHHSMTATITIG